MRIENLLVILKHIYISFYCKYFFLINQNMCSDKYFLVFLSSETLNYKYIYVLRKIVKRVDMQRLYFCRYFILLKDLIKSYKNTSDEKFGIKVNNVVKGLILSYQVLYRKF